MKTQVRGAKLLLTAGIALTLAIGMLSLGRTADASHVLKVDLGVAAPFAILAGTAITDVPTSMITGNVGLHPGPGAAIGLNCVQVTGTIYSRDAGGPLPCRVTDAPTLVLAKAALTLAIGDAAGRLGGVAVNPNPLTPNELAAQVLPHGIYKSTVAAMSLAVGGTVTLNGGPNDVFIFQVPTQLTIGNGSFVKLTGGAQACNVFWQVDTAVIGTTADFVGTILAATQITVANGSTVNGRLLAGTADVTLINDTIKRSTCAAPAAYVPLPTDTPTPSPSASPSASPTASARPTASATPGAATPVATSAPTASPASAVQSLPSTATLEDNMMFLILPILLIVFAVLYMVARARRRRAPPVV